VSEAASFQSPGATLYPSEVKQGATSSAVSGSSIALTYTPYQAGDLLAVMVCSTNTSGTITLSDTVNTWVAVDGPTALNGGTYCKTFYATGIAATALTGATALTASFSGGAVTFHDILLEEFANASTLDKHNLVNTTSSTGGALTGTGVLTTSANEAMFGGALCANCNISTSAFPNVTVSTASWTQENNDGAGNVSGYWVVSATGTYAVAFIDAQGTGNADVTAIMTFH
jgi:hypothetical protein